jgi:hypothetical protein
LSRRLTQHGHQTDLIDIVGSGVQALYDDVVTPLASVCTHYSRNARLAAASCMRALSCAIPSKAAQLAGEALTRANK